MDNLGNREFADLTYQTIITIKGIPRRKLIRRKSCDTLMFGGPLSQKKDNSIQVDRPYDILYRDFMIQLIKRGGKASAANS